MGALSGEYVRLVGTNSLEYTTVDFNAADDDSDDGKFCPLRLLRHLRQAARPDGKVDMDAFGRCNEQFARFISEQYGLFGSIAAPFLRRNGVAWTNFLDQHRIMGDDRNAATILELCNPSEVKARKLSCPGYQIAVNVAFLSYILRIWEKRFEPEAPGTNFLLDPYSETWGNFHPWLVRKTVSLMLTYRRGKEAWMQRHLNYEQTWPANSFGYVVEAFVRVRDDMAAQLQYHGFQELVYI